MRIRCRTDYLSFEMEIKSVLSGEMAINIKRFFAALRFAQNESEIPHSERSEESPLFKSQ